MKKGVAHNHDSRANGRRNKQSIASTYERYEGKKALMAEWANILEPDDPYLKRLEEKVHFYRQQLKYKGESL
jgi:hypothetical protein